MFIIFFLFLVSTFYFYLFLFLTAWQFVTRHPPPATRHPLPVTRDPPPVTRHPRKSPAVKFVADQISGSRVYVLQSNQVKRTPQDSISELIIWKMNR